MRHPLTTTRLMCLGRRWAIAAIAALFPFNGAYAADNILLSEADSFLAGLPEGLQTRQTDAIRQAIAGNTAPLVAVRKSRDAVPELPEGVRRIPAGDNLAFFRSDKYANDTIPLLIYFHGGGWTIGSINSCSRFCAAMALNGVAVLAVDYKLAPEHGFPSGLNDCVSAVRTALDSLETWKCRGVSLGGDSSGGNLAIATAISFPAGTFDALAAFYPVTRAYPDNSKSWEEYGLGYGLDSELMEAFNDAYTTDTHNPLVSPMEAPDDALRNLPPTLIVAAERDILRDQGAEFADRLNRLGIPVEYLLVPGSVHLFITVPGQPAAFNRSVSSTTSFLLRNH